MPLPLAAGAAAGLLKSGLGQTILSGVKNTIGANPLGLAVGAGQSILGAIKKKKADAMMPPPEDVGERALLNTLRRRQQALSTGTAYNPQITAGKQMAKSFMKNSLYAGGTPNQGAYGAMLNQAMGNVTQQTSQDMAQALGQEGQLVKDMANRKADLTLLRRNEENAAAAELTKSGGQNLMAAVMPSDQNYKAGATPKDESGAYDFTKNLYSENETLKKKMKELEEQMKASKVTTE
jgi:hypothetical protein